MNKRDWKAATTLDAACRRASGRRAYNKRRQFMAHIRRCHLVKLMNKYPPGSPGLQRKLAKELRVSPATICRDIKTLNRLTRGPTEGPSVPLPPLFREPAQIVVYDASLETRPWDEPAQGG
jgi:hypothetical protein